MVAKYKYCANQVSWLAPMLALRWSRVVYSMVAVARPG